jgi:hypothetical protein
MLLHDHRPYTTVGTFLTSVKVLNRWIGACIGNGNYKQNRRQGLIKDGFDM